MKSALQTVGITIRCVVWMLLLPFSHAGYDRIAALKAYEHCLWPVERYYLGSRFFSLLGWLRRAARRQERINLGGNARYDRLQAHSHEAWFAYLFHARIIFFILAFGYAGDALEHILRTDYPALYVHWQVGIDLITRSVDRAFERIPVPR